MWATVRDQNVIVGFGVTYYYDYTVTGKFQNSKKENAGTYLTRLI